MPCDHHVWAFSMCAQVTFQTVNVLYQLHAICQESLYGAHCSLYGSTAFLKRKFEQYMGDINCSNATWTGLDKYKVVNQNDKTEAKAVHSLCDQEDVKLQV